MKRPNPILSALTIATFAAATLALNSTAAEIPAQLARPDGKPADQTKNQGYHYNRNAETFYEVGERLGWAMAELLKGTK